MLIDALKSIHLLIYLFLLMINGVFLSYTMYVFSSNDVIYDNSRSASSEYDSLDCDRSETSEHNTGHWTV